MRDWLPVGRFTCGLAALVVLISVVACERSTDRSTGERHERPEQATIEQLGERAVIALVENDEEAFVRLHVREGDMTPNGEFMIATGAGKALPDARWESDVREAFKRARGDLERVLGGLGGVSFVGVRDVETHDEGERGGWFYKLRVDVRTAAKAGVLTFMSGAESQRGWVLDDDPVVVVQAC